MMKHPLFPEFLELNLSLQSSWSLKGRRSRYFIHIFIRSESIPTMQIYLLLHLLMGHCIQRAIALCNEPLLIDDFSGWLTKANSLNLRASGIVPSHLSTIQH
jgi:hypothetical protein